MGHAIHVFTSAALNYIPKVRLLFNSLRHFHPDWHLHLLLADKLPDGIDLSTEPFDSLTQAQDLGISDWKGWSFCHTITELATATKPWMLEKLLIESGENGRVIYLDPDTVVFSPLLDIIDALEESSIVLTPHQTAPDKTLQAIMDNEVCSLKHGIYNLGFIGVSNTPVGRSFARWWAERTYHFCRDDIPNGLFTDQRWIDLVPAFFPSVAIMRSTRHNVATWNITTRQLTCGDDNNYYVDGRPLGFYHFTGFDSGAHIIMAAKNASGNRALSQLVSWYTSQIKPLQSDPLSHRPWAFNCFDSGAPIQKEQRVVYRNRTDLQKAFPDPFAMNAYEEWWGIQAKIEYPSLFDEKGKDEAIKKLDSPLTPGFMGSDYAAPYLGRAADLLRQSLANPSDGIQIARKAWEVLRNDGWSGVYKKLSQ